MAEQSRTKPAPSGGSSSEDANVKAKAKADRHAQDIKQDAGTAADATKQKVAEATEQVKDEFNKAKDAVQQEATRATNSVREKGRRAANEQKGRLAGEIDACSTALKDAAGKYNEQSETNLGNYAKSAGEQFDRAKNYLEDRELEDILEDVEQRVREHRELAFGACFVAGLGLARFLKASGEKRSSNGKSSGQAAVRSPRPSGTRDPMATAAYSGEPTTRPQVSPTVDSLSTDTSRSPSNA